MVSGGRPRGSPPYPTEANHLGACTVHPPHVLKDTPSPAVAILKPGQFFRCRFRFGVHPASQASNVTNGDVMIPVNRDNCSYIRCFSSS